VAAFSPEMRPHSSQPKKPRFRLESPDSAIAQAQGRDRRAMDWDGGGRCPEDDVSGFRDRRDTP
jgi:hypothetical protein